MAYKVLLTDHVYPDLEYEKKALAGVGAELVYLDSKDEATIAAAAVDADAIITCYANITPQVIAGAQKLRSVSKTGIGVNNIDIPAASAKGVRVLNCPDYCIEEVSDHSVALILAVARRIVVLDRATSNGVWSLDGARDMIRLRGKTFGLLGFGRIARMTAEKLKGFGMRTIAYDPYVDADQMAALGVEKAELNDVITQSHIISLNLPLTEETDKMVNDEFLSKMRDDAILVNTSRGGLIDEPALLRALQAGTIIGAGLDVLTDEVNTADNPLMKQPNCIVTPHAAFASIEATQELREKIIADVLLVLEGKEPKNQVNR
ncbi:MAG: C-terminal binding protein [Oscillospiraceae bacterium]|nr:C-terminal binding protein [Oscillospiraceae bacterium]